MISTYTSSVQVKALSLLQQMESQRSQTISKISVHVAVTAQMTIHNLTCILPDNLTLNFG